MLSAAVSFLLLQKAAAKLSQHMGDTAVNYFAFHLNDKAAANFRIDRFLQDHLFAGAFF